MVSLETFHEKSDIDVPKRWMKYVLIWCLKGNTTIVVDDKELELKQFQVITITSGQIHYFKKLNAAEGFILEFTFGFFCKDDKDIELIFHNGLFCHFDLNEVITIQNFQTIETQLKLIQEELLQQPYQYLTSIHSRIELILVEINRAKVNRGDEIYKPDALFLKFLELARANFKSNFPLSHFASVLNTTEAKLNEQSKLHTGKTAQNVIYGLIISEAKRLLIYQDLSIKEVAFELGFNDPFYFSNFFKKHTRQSPKYYKSNPAL
ncbi:MAG: helix-turn-helix domain-containing protein [Chitinophagales bacterium]|nr:helix-turn-helix domain-containing protein [Chitinophagales bacterium]